jgi:alkaline phosphatase D
MRRPTLALAGWLLACALPAAPPPPVAVDRIAVGSCLRQHAPQPVWDAILAAKPDLFVFAGDNVYADTTDVAEMRAAYAALGANPGFRRLRENVPVLATWDDHDYGADDAGAEYPAREASQRVFTEFFGLPAVSTARRRPGVYDAHALGPPGRHVQVILLDTRYFRSPARRAPPTRECPRINHAPTDDPAASVLGEDQWTWLARRLREPADLRVIVSSIQVIPDSHCFEKWANFPRERERLLRLLRESGATGVVLVTGDRHHADISRLPADAVGYPLYELTASGLNSARAGPSEHNRFRVGHAEFRGDHFGLLRVDWEPPDPELSLEVRDVAGRTVRAHRVRLSELRP